MKCYGWPLPEWSFPMSQKVYCIASFKPELIHHVPSPLETGTSRGIDGKAYTAPRFSK